MKTHNERRSVGHTWWAPPDLDVSIQNITEEFAALPDPGFLIRHAFWVLGYAFTPGIVVRTGSTRKHWEPWLAHSAMLHAPLSPFWHDLQPACPPQHGVWLAFKGGEKLGLQTFLPARQTRAHFLDPTGALGELLVAAAHRVVESKDAGYWDAEATLFRAVDMLHNSGPVSDGIYRLRAPSLRATGDPVVAVVRNFLKDNLSRSLRRKDIARHAGMSLSKLAHHYGAATGEGPMTTLLRMRVQAARDLLLQGHSVKSASEATGFSSPYHLSRAFKALNGQSPRAFLNLK